MADLPATVDQSGLVVTGQVEGTDTRLEIDTASQQTVLTPMTAQLLARTEPSPGLQSGGRFSLGTAPDAFAEIALGKVTFQRQVPVASISGPGGSGPGGVIGGDLLSDHDLELDLPDHRVRLWQAPRCGLTDLPWTGPRDAVAGHVTGGELLRVPVTINGQKVEAVLDSEASVSLMPTSMARRLGVTLGELGSDATVAVHGVARGSISARMHRFGTLTIGQDQIKNPSIGVANFQPATGEIVLGRDYLRDHRVWVSYRTGQMFVQAAHPGAMAGVDTPTGQGQHARP
jgi:hypothetical protein